MRTPKKLALVLAGTLALAAGSASAHVTYLLSGKAFDDRSGQNWKYLFSGLDDRATWVAALVTVLAAAAGYALYTYFPRVRAFFSHVASKADSYVPFAPWMLRLSLGVALIGSGAQEFLVSPILKGYAGLADVQVLLGFLLMAGLLVVPASFGALAVYLLALGESWTIVGSFEFAAIALALIVLDNERPGLDDMLGVPKMSPFRSLSRWTPVLLRVGIGLAMASMALYEKLLNPLAGDAIVRGYGLVEVIPVAPAMWVLGAGVIELILGVLHIVGWKTRPVVGLTFIVLSLSFFYFKEDVASHVTLFGGLSALFILKAGPWSLDARAERRAVAKA